MAGLTGMAFPPFDLRCSASPSVCRFLRPLQLRTRGLSQAAPPGDSA